eukprot:XP_015148371.1 semaphorin-3D isoform X5 [Gallus gallus]
MAPLAAALLWVLLLLRPHGAGTWRQHTPRLRVTYRELLKSNSSQWLLAPGDVPGSQALLLDEDRAWLMVGSKNHIILLHLEQPGREPEKISWPAPRAQVEHCRLAGKDVETECANFIRLLQPYNSSHVLACGTGAYQPVCAFVQLGAHGKGPGVPVIRLLSHSLQSGRGRCPYSPRQPFAALLVDGQLYSGTSSDFMGSSAAFFRTEVGGAERGYIRTEQHQDHWLHEPTFVGAFAIPDTHNPHDDKVYVFFRETALEGGQWERRHIHARVARVCKVSAVSKSPPSGITVPTSSSALLQSRERIPIPGHPGSAGVGAGAVATCQCWCWAGWVDARLGSCAQRSVPGRTTSEGSVASSTAGAHSSRPACCAPSPGPRARRHTLTSWVSASHLGLLLSRTQHPATPLTLSAEDVFLLHTRDPQNPLVFGLFTASSAVFSGSAVCVYSMAAVRAAFSGPFAHKEGFDHRWVQYKGRVPYPRPGTCPSETYDPLLRSTKDFPDEVISFVRAHQLMWEPIRPLGRRPVLLRANVPYRLRQLLVHRLEAEGRHYDVLFLGTDDGKVLKVGLPGEVGAEAVSLEEISVTEVPSPILDMKLSPKRQELLVSSMQGLLQLSLSRCELYGPTCMDCCLARDPYCTWDGSACTPLLLTEKRPIHCPAGVPGARTC